MKIVRESVHIDRDAIGDGVDILKRLEQYGRVCYKSEENITDDSCIDFCKKIIESGHESVFEHEKLTVLVVCDREVSYELVRHRIASYSQESMRYYNYYSGDKFENELTFIKPLFWEGDSECYRIWEQAMSEVEHTYMELIQNGASAQEARSVLPNSLKTETVITMNIREWRHFFKLHTAPLVHPQMREVAFKILWAFLYVLDVPVLFDEFEPTMNKYFGLRRVKKI